jgi:hypothetical protein
VSLLAPVMRAGLKLRGTLQFRRADGSVCKEVELDGVLPLDLDLALEESLEPPHGPDHP